MTETASNFARQKQSRRLERAAAAAGRRQDNAATATDAWRTQRQVYRNLRREKREAFWQSTIDAGKSNPRCLWQSIDTLLGRGRPPSNEEISAERFQEFFEAKVASVRASTESAPMPDSIPGPPGVSWSKFDPVDCPEVTEAIRMLPNKSCAADPVPTSVLKQLADEVAPFLTALFNRSMTEGIVPAAFRTAFITPHLKKPDMDGTDVRSFRPILKPLRHLKVNAATGCSSSAELPHCEQFVTAVSVSVSTASLRRDRYCQSIGRHSAGDRQRRCSWFGIT